MIGLIEGKLVAKDLDSIEVMTSGGVGYEMKIPLGVYETLPRAGEDVTLHTSLVVKEDSWQLFGFTSVFEKRRPKIPLIRNPASGSTGMSQSCCI